MSDAAEVIDATTVDEAAAPDVPVEPSTELAVHAPRPTREALTPLDAEQVVAGMEAYQQLLPRLLEPSDYQRVGSKSFVKKSGWRKIARAFNLSVEIVSVRVLRDDTGGPVRAEAICRAIAPNGQVQDGDGYCAIDEDRFTSERANVSKIENDLRATATTRAKNRAISDLVGMGEVSAEEADAGTGTGLPSWAQPADGELLAQARRAVKEMGGAHAPLLGGKIAEACHGVLPVAVCHTLAYVQAALDAKGPPADG